MLSTDTLQSNSTLGTFSGLCPEGFNFWRSKTLVNHIALANLKKKYY